MDVHAFLVSILLKMYLFSHNIRYLLNIVQHTLNKGYQSIMVLVHKTPPLFLFKCLYQVRKSAVMYLCVRGINFASFYDFGIGF